MKKYVIGLIIATVSLVSCGQDNSGSTIKEFTKCDTEDCKAPDCENIDGVLSSSMPENYTGTSYSCFPNGKVWAIGHYVNGKREGEMLTYYENGRLWQRMNWKNDFQHGKQFDYYENGTLKRSSNYNMKDRDGEMIEYDENGKYLRTLIWKDFGHDDELIGCEGDCEQYKSEIERGKKRRGE